MAEVTIHNNLCKPADLYAPDGTYVGTAKNDEAIADAHLQIKTKNLKGYYWIFEGVRINIDRHGTCEHYPNGFNDTFGDICAQLV